jgi:rifampicin phosphotransferase
MRNILNCQNVTLEEDARDDDERDIEWVLFERAKRGTAVFGRGASPGIDEGPATVVSDADDPTALSRIKKGSLLVCGSASKSLLTVIPRLAALVADRGGTLAIAPAVAREHGVPAVVATMNLTEIINDGDIIRIDGTNGIVKIIRTRSEHKQ